MKKFLLIGIAASIVFAARYPIVFEYNYMKGCVNGSDKIKENAKVEYCICSLKAIENKYTLNEVIEKVSSPEGKQEIVNYATKKCLHILTSK